MRSAVVRAVSWVAGGIAVNVGFSMVAGRCPIIATTTTNYMASSYAAALIEYADCATKIVKVVTSRDGLTQLDLSSNQIVNITSLPSVVKLNLRSNRITYLENVDIPSTAQAVDLSKNAFTSLQGLKFPENITNFTASNGKLASLYNISFPDSIAVLNLSSNPIKNIGGVVFPSTLTVLSITSTTKLVEFEVRQTDAKLFSNLKTFNVSMTTSFSCSDTRAMHRYIQETLLCVLPDDIFSSKYGIKGEDYSSSGSVDIATSTPASESQVSEEASNPRRLQFLLFAAISLSVACIGLMSTLAPRTLYERYQKNKFLNLRMKKQQEKQQQISPVSVPTTVQRTEEVVPVYWDI